MRSRPEKLALSLLIVSAACAAAPVLAKKVNVPAATPEQQQKQIVHALNRLTFGARPQDVQQVTSMGLDRWIDLQLYPERIDNSALESKLAQFRTLRISSRELAESFPDGQMIKQVMDGKRPMPSDPARHAIYQVQIARQQEKQERKAEAANTPPPATNNADGMNNTAMVRGDAMSAGNGSPATDGAEPTANGSGGDNKMAAEAKPSPEEEAEARRREEHLYADLEVQALPQVPAEQRYKKILAMPLEQQLSFADSLRGGKGQEFLEGLDPRQKETLQAMNNPQGVLADELMQAKLLRAIYSDRQLEEVMTDFWFNHFNIFINKGPEKLFLAGYEQETIRPHALGKFEDLLVATAKSPAMLFYLDNWLSVGPDSMQALGIPAHPANPYRPYRFPPRPNGNRKANAGLNENYGRELLELHTLSVNGGYTQRDVTETAKVFTGWTIDKPNEGGGFKFEPRRHEPGPKFVLGKRIKPKGEEEGLELLHRLATSPQTAHFISLKLAQRFVSDDPPPALVDAMAKTFLKKKGEIREVLLTMFHSPEFWAGDTYRAKLKTPLEFVASAVRATDADVQDALPLVRQLNNMGMPLYGAQPPTGYSMKAETWISTSALLNRMNFSLALTSGKIRGVTVNAAQVAGSEISPADPSGELLAMEKNLLAADVSKQTHDSIVAQMQPPPKPAGKKSQPPPGSDAATIAGLLLGSPEFQRR